MYIVDIAYLVGINL